MPQQAVVNKQADGHWQQQQSQQRSSSWCRHRGAACRGHWQPCEPANVSKHRPSQAVMVGQVDDEPHPPPLRRLPLQQQRHLQGSGGQQQMRGKKSVAPAAPSTEPAARQGPATCAAQRSRRPQHSMLAQRLSQPPHRQRMLGRPRQAPVVQDFAAHGRFHWDELGGPHRGAHRRIVRLRQKGPKGGQHIATQSGRSVGGSARGRQRSLPQATTDGRRCAA